jgi:glycerophosphoryl diester phosphodiesterase
MTLRALLGLSVSALILIACDPAEEGVLPEASPPEAVEQQPEQNGEVESDAGLQADMGMAEPVALGADLPAPAFAVDVPGGNLVRYLQCITGGVGAVVVSAHRGGPLPGWPENALETFANTLAHGPMMLEMDIRQTADGVLMIMHDDSLDRTTTGEGAIRETEWADIQTLSLIDDEGEVTAFRAPSLDEVLDWARGRAILQLDVKRDVDVADVVEAVRRNNAEGFAKIITYNAEDAVTVSEQGEGIVFSLQITEPGQLDALIEAGGDRDRLIAWTGIGRDRREELWSHLQREAILVSAGTMWRLDDDIRESGDPAPFLDFTEGYVDILATDLHIQAYDVLQTRQDTVAAFRACVQEF